MPTYVQELTFKCPDCNFEKRKGMETLYPEEALNLKTPSKPKCYNNDGHKPNRKWKLMIPETYTYYKRWFGDGMERQREIAWTDLPIPGVTWGPSSSATTSKSTKPKVDPY